MQKKLSIIIPIYNASLYLSGCLESLLRQTFTDFEALCIDDGSTDGCDKILKSFAQRDNRIKIFTQENKGVSAARNVGLDNASGEWICFLDADDTIEADWLERIMRYAKNGIDVVHVNPFYCFGGVSQKWNGSFASIALCGEGWSWLNFIRNKSLGTTRYKEGMRLKEDSIFFAELFSKPLKIEYVNEKGYNYILRSDSATHQFATDDDCLRFFHEAYQLPLSREEIARAIGYDLILWIGWRNWSNGYDSSKCKILAFWRDGVESGRLRYDDVRLWWRLGLKRWIKTGDVSLLRRTYFLRVKFEKSLFICALKRLVGAFRK